MDINNLNISQSWFEALLRNKKVTFIPLYKEKEWLFKNPDYLILIDKIYLLCEVKELESKDASSEDILQDLFKRLKNKIKKANKQLKTFAGSLSNIPPVTGNIFLVPIFYFHTKTDRDNLNVELISGFPKISDEVMRNFNTIAGFGILMKEPYGKEPIVKFISNPKNDNVEIHLIENLFKID